MHERARCYLGWQKMEVLALRGVEQDLFFPTLDEKIGLV